MCRHRSAQARKQENPVTVFGRILTVCVGNICRSPTAEYLFRQQVASWGIQVGSAGLAAMVNSPVEGTAAQLMDEHGVDSSVHRARQVTPALLREADLVLGMEKSHLLALARLAPEASGKLFLFDKWCEARDIPDPYRQQRPAFEHVYAMIDRGVRSWLPYLR
ncbi:low molecular weight protein-tyrosine-phosphatase [Rhodanobacter sp. DHG33]|uniref:low molecular weight protein-tyrosine-phosphatase n=1 Tax=Rhodanobacter sp. DHG33 TaxID=2775921 RepID=UPI001CE04C7F|nr:low molecular weight protein-tyrosine-phosphatase [Rhodanobacter sp. DHG33]